VEVISVDPVPLAITDVFSTLPFRASSARPADSPHIIRTETIPSTILIATTISTGTLATVLIAAGTPTTTTTTISEDLGAIAGTTTTKILGADGHLTLDRAGTVTRIPEVVGPIREDPAGVLEARAAADGRAAATATAGQTTTTITNTDPAALVHPRRGTITDPIIFLLTRTEGTVELVFSRSWP